MSLDSEFIRKLQQLKIRTKKSFLGSRQGSHTSIKKGHGLEFADFRAYTPGDDFRYIDWQGYARTDRLYVKEFREETDLNVMLLIDCSASMDYPEIDNKFELSKDIALALGYIALTEGDSVNFSFLGNSLSPRFRGAKSLGKAQAIFKRVNAVGQIDLINEIRASVSRLKVPGKCFLISDLMYQSDTTSKAIDLLRAKNFEIVVLQILSMDELSLKPEQSKVLLDSENREQIEINLDSATIKEYSELLSAHISEIEQYCRRAGIKHLLIPSNRELSEIMFQLLPETGILR